MTIQANQENIRPSCKGLSINNIFFDSLRSDYSGFDKWWRVKCVQKRRECWVVYDENDELAGLVVRKDESANDTDATFKKPKILKICTFKVSPMNRGIKLGELLLKQVLWYGQSNGYNSVYLTSYPQQTVLLNLLEYYGFKCTAKSDQGELTYERLFHQSKISSSIVSPFDFHRTNYPRFVSSGVKGFRIPIKGDYHDTLFPDVQDNFQIDIFSPTDQPNKPGNTIRKVYLCHAKSKLGDPGSLLFFYKGKSLAKTSQAITAVGVLENFSLATSTQELTRLAGGRSVYSEKDLISFNASEDNPVKVINFLLACYIEPPFTLEQMNDIGISLPQSIAEVKTHTLAKLLRATKLDDKTC